MNGLKRVLTVLLLLAITPSAASAQSESALVAAGREIYERGVVASGEALVARREGGIVMRGRNAACTNCHRPSGFGLSEGTIVVPPVTGPALFANARLASATPRRARGMKFKDYAFNRRQPYTDETLGRALREGISPTGDRFGFLMPRYDLGPADMSAVTAYLRQLSATASPGLEGRGLHIATIVAPEQSEARKTAMLGVLQACFKERYPEEHDEATFLNLHVWELAGPASTWQQQLQVLYDRRPVFAVLSGLGGIEWQPVHDFCEGSRIPCLFPNVEAAGSVRETRHAFYFSPGVVLEAQVAARHLDEQLRLGKFNRVVQVFTATGIGPFAADALRRALKSSVDVVDRPISEPAAAAMAGAFTGLRENDALLIWFDRTYFEQLSAVEVPNAALMLANSAAAVDGVGALPPSWRGRMSIVYPFDAPVRLQARMALNLRPWLATNGVPVEDERLQGNTLAACNLLTESVARLRGGFHRDRLIELIESYPSAMGNAPAPQAYPRFSLGPGQRFSSKGAYIVHYTDKDGGGLALEHDWIVP